MISLNIPNNLVSVILQQLLIFFNSFLVKNLNTLDLNSKEKELSLSCSKLIRQTARNLLLSRLESLMKMIKRESSTFKGNRIFSKRSPSASISFKLTNHSTSQKRKNRKLLNLTMSKRWTFVIKI